MTGRLRGLVVRAVRPNRGDASDPAQPRSVHLEEAASFAVADQVLFIGVAERQELGPPSRSCVRVGRLRQCRLRALALRCAALCKIAMGPHHGLHADPDDSYRIVARLMDAMPSGSYLAMAHAASDIAPEASAEMARFYNGMSSVPITPRSREQVARFFDGLDMTPPGLVPISRWGLVGQIDTTVGGIVGYCGIGRKR